MQKKKKLKKEELSVSDCLFKKREKRDAGGVTVRRKVCSSIKKSSPEDTNFTHYLLSLMLMESQVTFVVCKAFLELHSKTAFS